MRIGSWGLVQGSLRNKFILPSMPLLTHWTFLPPLGGHSPPTKFHCSPFLPPSSLGLLLASSGLHFRTPQALSQWVGMGSHPVRAAQGALHSRATLANSISSIPGLLPVLTPLLKKVYLFLFGCTGLICSTWGLRHSLWHTGSLVVACGILTKDQTQAPPMGTWSLNHWATREVSKLGVVKGEVKD